MTKAGKTTKRRGRRPETRLTAVQRRTLKLVEQSIRRRGQAPTIQEMAETLGVAGPSVHDHISQLVRKGYLARERGKTRGLRLARDPGAEVARLVSVPVIGMVAAGEPILAEENILGEVLVEGYLVEHGRCFALRVRGESMVDANIRNGDMVIVRQQPLAESGEIVVALVDGEATVKRLYIADHELELRPENKKHRPIKVGPDTDLRIVGKVVAVRRIARQT